MGQIIVYGLGGHDETKPNNNIIEIIEVEEEVTVDESDSE